MKATEHVRSLVLLTKRIQSLANYACTAKNETFVDEASSNLKWLKTNSGIILEFMNALVAESVCIQECE